MFALTLLVASQLNVTMVQYQRVSARHQMESCVVSRVPVVTNCFLYVKLRVMVAGRP